jgi:hypothetical protein
MADELCLYRQAIQEAHAIAKAYPFLKNGGERLQKYIQDVHMPAKNYRSLKEDLEPVAIRLPLSIIAYIDGTILPTLQAQTPWAKVGRSDAVRYLVQLGMEAGFSGSEKSQKPKTASLSLAPAPASQEPGAQAPATKACRHGHSYAQGLRECPECKKLRSHQRTRGKGPTK